MESNILTELFPPTICKFPCITICSMIIIIMYISNVIPDDLLLQAVFFFQTIVRNNVVKLQMRRIVYIGFFCVLK